MSNPREKPALSAAANPRRWSLPASDLSASSARPHPPPVNNAVLDLTYDTMESSTDAVVSPAVSNATNPYVNLGDNKNAAKAMTPTGGNTASGASADEVTLRPRTETMWAQPRPYSMPVDQVKYEQASLPGNVDPAIDDPGESDELYELVEMDRVGVASNKAAGNGSPRRRRDVRRSESTAYMLPAAGDGSNGAVHASNSSDDAAKKAGSDEQIRRLRRLVIIFGIIAILAIVVGGVGVGLLYVRVEALSEDVDRYQAQLAASDGGEAGDSHQETTLTVEATNMIATVKPNSTEDNFSTSTMASTEDVTTANDVTSDHSLSTVPSTSQTQAPPTTATTQATSSDETSSLLFAIGGRVGPTRFSTVEVFDGQEWTSSVPLLTARDGFGAGVLQNKLYVVGGKAAGGVIVSSVEVFDGDTWQQAASMQGGRTELAVAVLNDKLFAIGGQVGQSNVDTVEVFDGVEWSAAPAMPPARRGGRAAVFQNKIYVIGGITTHYKSYTNKVEAFDGDNWREAPSMPTARRHPAVVTFGGRLFVIGGVNVNDLDIVESFDGDGWNTETAMHITISHPNAAVFQNNVYVIGEATEDDTDVAEFDGVSWTSGPALSTPRLKFNIAVLPSVST